MTDVEIGPAPGVPGPAQESNQVSSEGGAAPETRPPGAMLIGEVAERLGLTQRTLRYYEEKGLLPPAPRLEGGYRLYSEADVHRLEHILELKRFLGFSLLEIKEIVEADEERRELRSAFRREVDPAIRRAQATRALEIARFQITKLDQHLEGLQQLRRKVEARVQRYENELSAMSEQDSNVSPARCDDSAKGAEECLS